MVGLARAGTYLGPRGWRCSCSECGKMRRSQGDVIQDAGLSTGTSSPTGPHRLWTTKFEVLTPTCPSSNERDHQSQPTLSVVRFKNMTIKHRPDFEEYSTPEIATVRVAEAWNCCCNLGSRAWITEVNCAGFVLTTLPLHSLDGSSIF